MQKKLIALAVASVASGAAFAQTNVTLYGVADAGYLYSSGGAGYVNGNGALGGVKLPGTNTFSGIQSGLLSGSRLGFRGEENLGNGLKAIFTLEYGLNLDTNTGVGWSGSDTGVNARQQFVGLSGEKWGTVALGRQYSPGYLATARNDPLGGATFESQSFLSSQAGYTITPNNAARWNNAITYATPNWSGFSAKAIYSFGEATTKDATVPSSWPKGVTVPVGSYNDKIVSVTDNSKYGIGLNYANGPLNVDALWQARHDILLTGVTQPDDNGVPVAVPSYSTNEWYVGASYDFKVAKVMGSWQGLSVSNTAKYVNNSQADSQLWSIGAVIPVLAASNIHLAYAQVLMDGSNRALIPLTGDSQSATLAWTTSLSKRTTLYAGYVWTKNDGKGIAASPAGGGILTGAVGARDETNNSFTAGLNHAF